MIAFSPPGAGPEGCPQGSEVISLPCGQCIGCRLENSRQWAIRCSHEAQLYDNNSFITLTYNNQNLPPSGTLVLRDFQLFLKRLRKHISPTKLRFYHCGEYGSNCRECGLSQVYCKCDIYQPGLGRPHYHACLFNYDFADRRLHKIANEQRLYTSHTLDQIWGKGHSLIGDVTFQSAAYVARYITKKINGEKAENHYINRDGEILKPEYTTMSRMPGLGSAWLNKYKSDVYPGDFVVMNNKKMRPPKFYDTQYELTNPEEFALIKQARIDNAELHKEDQTYDRLKTREQIQKERYKKLHRKYEKDNE
jgi:hypothetical protein